MEGGIIDDFILLQFAKVRYQAVFSGLRRVRKLLLQNVYPAGVVNYNINDVLNRQQKKPKNPTTTVPKKKNNLSSTLFRGTKQNCYQAA